MTKKVSKKKKEKCIMFCSKCKSIDVSMDKSNPVQPSMGLPPMYICNKCGHSGYSFPEVPVSEIDKFQKEAKKKGLVDSNPDKTPKVDISYGNFEVRVLWKVSAPLIVLFGIFLLFLEPVSGTVVTIAGLIMFYITYFKKRKFKDE